MSLNIKKSSLISGALVPNEGRIIPRTKPFLKHRDEFIKMAHNFEPTKYLGHLLGSSGVLKPTIHNLKCWLQNVSRSALKPDQKLAITKIYVIPKVLYGLQQPGVTSRILREADRLIKHHIKHFLHLNIHTPDAAIHAKVRDGGLGVTQLRGAIPTIYLGRLRSLLGRESDPCINFIMQTDQVRNLMHRLENLVGEKPHQIYWADMIKSGPLTTGLELAADDSASRSWIDKKPTGWSGRDYTRAVQLRSANLPTAGLPSNPPDQRQCRAGCNKVESLCHVLQGCPATHWERITRHNHIAKKLAAHCRTKGWSVSEEPHVRHTDGTLFKPDLIATKGQDVVVSDVQVVWEGAIHPAQQHLNKRRKYQDDAKFQETIDKMFPGKNIIHEPLTIGARGTWPRCNQPTEDLFRLDNHFKSSCVAATLKFGSSIHAAFGRTAWRRR